MLVLSRKAEQRIRIGDDIEVTVLAVEGDHVKLGICAPRHITVLRHELLEDVQAENRRAAAAVAGEATLGSMFQRLARIMHG
jgi:carbon storage regulator